MKDKRQLLSGQPDLVISVIGGGKKFQLEDTRKKDIFNHGLIEVNF